MYFDMTQNACGINNYAFVASGFFFYPEATKA